MPDYSVVNPMILPITLLFKTNSKSIALNKEKRVKQEQIYTETVFTVFTLKPESQYIFGSTISPR